MVAIRLRRAGSKKRPFFRVVVTDSRAARDSCSSKSSATTTRAPSRRSWRSTQERVDYWLKKGAQPSDSCAR